ncbi:MAG: hypothetical protein CL943_01315 [Candidatus Diapherotrites archaeon]|uniref:Uncharacterized protein n=1 Tax=Candidatus Iainarchaeum sp. TaxID=3101447 RepID=A0A2D6M0J7_9ARCH|nr:hypothetical protein [Candidatus Diapherotrites archaeon]|tara:strand:- start:5319 stop:5588 length:270 start_codon:yes stop_codon:yes gene_type:complete
MDAEIKKELEHAVELMQEIVDDRGVPRNIRGVIEKALDKIGKESAETMDFSSAIYLLDDISNDINMPFHTRSDIWEIISKLEAVKEKMK